MKKWIISIIVLVLIGVGFYYGYQKATEEKYVLPPVTSPELPVMTESVSFEPLVFKQKWNVGERTILRVETISNTETQIPTMQLPVKFTQKFDQDISITVLTTLPNGGYEIEFQFERMMMEMDMSTVKFVYDTDSESTTEFAKEIGPVFNALVNHKLRVQINAKGEAVDVQGLQELIDEIQKNSKSPGSKPVANVFSADYMKSMMKNFQHQSIPERSIQVNESWPYQEEFNVGMGKMKMDLHYTFAGWKEIEGVKYALLNFNGTAKGAINPPANTNNQMQMNIQELNFAGYMFLDPVKGVSGESSQNQNMIMEMVMQVPDRRGTKTEHITMKMQQLVKAKILRVEPVVMTVAENIQEEPEI